MGNRKRKRRKNRNGGRRRSANDPLQSFDGGSVNLDDLEVDDGDMSRCERNTNRDGKRQKQGENEKETLLNTLDGTGQSTAGRNTWKEKHRKGKFSKKTRLANRKHKDPLGL